MTRPLVEVVEQFCQYQLKQRGKTEGGVQAYRWNLEQFLVFTRARLGRVGRLSDLTKSVIQEWMDDMAARDLSLNTMRIRQSTLSSLCGWLVKREWLMANPVSGMDRPPHAVEPPKQVPTPGLMDALIEAARKRGRPRDVAIFLILRFTGMRRESVATLQVRHLDALWGLRRVRVKGGATRDIPLPKPVMRYLHAYVEQCVLPAVGTLTPETPLFWSVWGRRSVGKHRAPMTGKNIWRLCKLYGRMIGYPMLKPHDLRHGVAMEVLEQRHDLEQVRALLGHARIDTTQIYTMIRPAQLKQAVSFYEEPARRILASFQSGEENMFEEHPHVPQTRSLKLQ
ncbi:MAG: tyrosine-type recombinase/integrase [Nitrospira sp. BO4]|jgi:site-specific recombinase XerD|nr:tyrosine-type recombinase/integrase [Nitrospira sp. BO4]